MSKSRTISYSIGSGENRRRGEVTLTGSKCVSVSENVPASSSIELAIPIDVSALRLIFAVPDGDEDGLSITFNGPDLEVSLGEIAAFVWTLGQGIENPFGVTDVTSISVMNEGDNDTRIYLEILTDATP